MAQMVRIEGYGNLKLTLTALPDDLAKIAPPDAALIIGREAQKRAPKRTGKLSRSFEHSEKDGEVSIAFDVEYAAPINWGVGPRRGKRGPHNIRKTEFLTGAARDKRDAWMKEYEDEVVKAVSKVKGA